jgi:hypothetical protein
MNTNALSDDIATYTSVLPYIYTDAKGRKETSGTDSKDRKQAMTGDKYNDGNGRIDKDRKHNAPVRSLASSTPRTSRGTKSVSNTTSSKKRPREDVGSSSNSPPDKCKEFNALVNELRSFKHGKFIDFAMDEGTDTSSNQLLSLYSSILPLYHFWY